MKKLLFIVFAIGSTAICYSQKPFRLIELVTLNDNYKLEDHLAYGNDIEPILNRYNMHNVANFQVMRKVKGTGAEHTTKVGVFELESPEAMTGIFGDKEYNEKFVSRRDQIHDMTGMTFFLAKPIMEKEYDKNKTVLVDFIVMKDGHTLEERDDYFDRLISEFGPKHGLKRFAAYEVIQFVRGVGPSETTLINFYVIEENTLEDLTSDPDYLRSMVPVRDEIFDMDELTLFLTKSIVK